MNSLDELNVWISEIKDIDITLENIDILKSFIKFSPEKMADKLGIDRVFLTKEFNTHKREIHNNIIIFEKSLKLRDYDPNTFGFYYNGSYVRSVKSICLKYYQVNYKGKTIKFYPLVKYLYYDTGDGIIIFPINDSIRKVYVGYDDFNNNFLNIREYKINLLFKTTSSK